MNLKTITAIVLLCIFLGYGFLNGLDPRQLLNLQSLMIVVGGILLVLWFGFPQNEISHTWKCVSRALRANKNQDMESKLLSDVLRLARVHRMHGPKALEKTLFRVKDEFLRFGATLVAEGYGKIDLYTALEREHRLKTAEDLRPIRVLRTLARLSPALGMAGTIISLMKVMQELGELDSIGGTLGLALSSTLYGIMLSNLLFLPIMLKLERHAEENSSRRIMLIEAIMGLHQGEHPLRIAERLNSFDLYCKMNSKPRPSVQKIGRSGAIRQISAN